MPLEGTWNLTEANRLIDAGTERFLTAWGNAAKEDAIQRVPVDTGALRDSIDSELEGKETVVVYAGSETVQYALAVNFGGPHTPAQPFFTQAVETAKGQAEEIAGRSFSGGA